MSSSYEVQIKLTLSAAGPVLVSSGSDNQVHPEMADHIFLMGKSDGKDTYVIPGSSLKGVIRHYLCRQPDYSDGMIEELFGKIGGETKKSKIAFSDLYADMNTVQTEIRNSTALGGVSQSAKNGTLNNMQPVTRGNFCGNIRSLKALNAQELCMILDAIQAIDCFTICIGGKISRGFGRMHVSSFSMTLSDGYDPATMRPRIAAEYDSFVTAKTALSAECSGERKV